MIKIICKTCKKCFYDYLSNKRQFCSRKCAEIQHSKTMTENNPRYWLGKHRSKEDKEKISKNNFNKQNPGSLSSSWKGENVKYITFHSRVWREKGKASHCSVCGLSDKRLYQWANLSGDYGNINDYKQMCVPCHRAYDKKRRENGALPR